MGRKSFKVTCDVELKMICAPHTTLCKHDHIYINVELFGETQKSRLMHPCFPIILNDYFYFEKILWSPHTKKEAFKLLKESPVSIELRHLKTGCSGSALLAYTDSNAFSFLISDPDQTNDPINLDKNIELIPTENHHGPPPKVKFHMRTTIIGSETPVITEMLQNYSPPCLCCEALHLKRSKSNLGGQNISSHGVVYSCNCELHKSDNKDTQHCSLCHQDRVVTLCDKCLSKFKKKPEIIQCPNISDFEDEKMEISNEKFRPPFVVRKVPNNIVARKPDAYDSHYNLIVREQARSTSVKQKKLRRLRSCSPKKETSGPRHSSTTYQKCYGCVLQGNEVRISCDACNLTYRGERSNRNTDVTRPEPPLLKTYRETVDQKPIYPIRKTSCPICRRQKTGNPKYSQDDSLFTSCRPLYLLDGYRDMEKYFSLDCNH